MFPIDQMTHLRVKSSAHAGKKSFKGEEEENEFESYASGYLLQDKEETLIVIDIDFLTLM